jgi:hypothetical protein
MARALGGSVIHVAKNIIQIEINKNITFFGYVARSNVPTQGKRQKEGEREN